MSPKHRKDWINDMPDPHLKARRDKLLHDLRDSNGSDTQEIMEEIEHIEHRLEKR